jgi:hypothetical protein
MEQKVTAAGWGNRVTNAAPIIVTAIAIIALVASNI